MKEAPKPINEAARLAKLRSLKILDTPPEQVFTDIAKLASHICNTPMATLSLIDSERQWFKASVGLDTTETQRDIAFCAHAILERTPMIVEDALNDLRFSESPLVKKSPFIRFYAGTPLITDEGFSIGALCAIDTKPHELSAEQIELLSILGQLTVSELQARQKRASLNASERISHVGSWVWDLKGGGEIWTEELYRILGFEPYSFTSTHEALTNALHPEDQEKFKNGLDFAIKNKSPFGTRCRIIQTSGAVRSVILNGEISCDSFGTPELVVGTLTDVSDLAKVEQSLRTRAKEVEQYAQAKSNLLANMSHEIRTPLNGIVGMTSLMLDTPLTEEQREMMSTINAASNSLLVLLNDILDFSKLEAGQIAISPAPCDLKTTIEKVRSLLQMRCDEKHITLLIEIDNSVPRVCLADEMRVSQVLANLVGNAVKFTAENGWIRIIVKEEKRESHTSYLQFSVTDTGIGIPKDVRNEIFEPFSNSKALSIKKHSAGLGLSISKRLVELMGGSLWFNSMIGAGSAFHFTLPVKRVNQEDDRNFTTFSTDSAITKQVPPTENSYHVLIVEDNVVNQKIAAKLIQKEGCEVTIVENGKEALEFLEKDENREKLSLIFMDIQMPVMDGYDATLAIRAQESCGKKRLPIVALTAHAQAGDRDKCLACGMDDYLSKPVNRDLLRLILKRYAPTSTSAAKAA